jgi:phosphoglycerate dehydrogenase-like enzyme
MEYKIAIINSSSFGVHFPQHLERLKEIGFVERFTVSDEVPGKELAELLNGFNIVISSVTPFFTKEFFDNKDELLLISRHGIGYNNIDVEAAREHGTIVTIVPPLVERDAVAENAVTNLLSLIRETVASSEAAKEGRWKDRANFLGHDLTGKTVGVIGCGNIGSRVAEIMKNGFNMRLLVVDPQIDRVWLEKTGGELVDLDTLLKESDVISLNAKLNETSKYILNADTFKKVKKGVYITNTARGDLINEQDILNAIDKGIVAGLATDVMHSEPADKSHPYFKNGKILVTPHTSAYTMECLEGMGEKCVADVEAVINGKSPEFSV